MEINRNTKNGESSNLSPEDIDFINRNISSTTQANGNNVNVNGNAIGTYKQRVNKSLDISKKEAIEKLKHCNFKTSPFEIEELLKALFQDPRTKEGHWLFIAQHWNPRAINRVISAMIRQYNRGDVTIQNPPAYFTRLIKYRKKRRSTSINGTRKQQK